MNYPEYVLRRSKTLWRELEEAWQQELTTTMGVVRKRGTNAENAEEENTKAENTEGENTGAENSERENTEGGNAVKRFAEKMFSADGETAAETVRVLAAQERETRGLAEVSDTDGIREGNGGARWLTDELRRSTTEGIAPVRVQESAAVFAPTYEAADLQTLSQSVERDARRYDGGFLLY